MAERPPLIVEERPRPTRRQIIRRRLIALAALVGALAAAIVAVAAALPHVHHKRVLPPPPPPPRPFRVVFPEGFTRSQMADRVAAVARIAERKRHGRPVKLSGTQYVAATRRARISCFTPPLHRNLEGFLFPATYDFLSKTTSRQLVAAQLQAFCANWKRVKLSYARSKNLTPYDVLTIASMVEKEAVAPSERRLVAAVVYNRLHARMPLGIDATLRYGLHIPPTKSIRESQLHSRSPYNTRERSGLPPTPIANPGLASIQAAADPARVGYLYFVRKPDKVHHFFTASAAAFARYECAHGYGC